MQDAQDLVNATYGSGNLTDNLLKSMAAAGCDTSSLTPDDLISFDELHIMGRQATISLGRAAALSPDMWVLDIGSGLGGPARTLAAAFGCRVTGVDLSAEYVAASTALTERTGLAGTVEFQQADALRLPYEDGRFDAVFMIHVTMNIGDKKNLFQEARRVLKSGGRLALWEVCRGDTGDLLYPVPWANDERFNFLVSMADLSAAVKAAGFKHVESIDATGEASAWVRERMAAVQKPKNTARPTPDLDLIFTDFRLKRANISKNLLQGRIRVVRAIAVKER